MITMNEKLKYVVSWAVWPVLFTACMAVTALGFAYDKPILFFNLAYLMLIVALLTLEKLMPHEAAWNEDDGQTFANIAHTLFSKGTVQTLVLFSAVMGIASHITPASAPGWGPWPREWPLALQVALGVTLAEFGLYWAHRLGHEWKPLWRFHSVHHSATRLWIVNTGRFHFVDSVVSIVMGMAILVPLGAPMEVLIWLSAITAFIGMLTHCNVEVRLGPISWIFNTPELHRWHHSRDFREMNRNYCENVMIWDHVFRTYINPRRRPPVRIGIHEYMPPGFMAQLAWPFQRRRKAARG